MDKNYSINLSNFSLDKLRKTIQKQELIPSHKILLEEIEDRFKKLGSLGIKNLGELSQALKDKKGIEAFSIRSKIPVDYLVILRRHTNQYVAKPVNLKEFPGINYNHIEQLEKLNTKNSKHLFEKTQTADDIKQLAQQTGILTTNLEEIIKLANLVRIWGVGAVFARIMYNSGVDTIEKFATSDVEKSYKAFVKTNKEGNYSSVHFSLKDIEFCVDFAKELIVD